MILDALTRAEHERQLENQPDLKFVTPVKPRKNKTNKIWLWVGIAVLVNALILYILARTLMEDAKEETSVATVSSVTPSAVDAFEMSDEVKSNMQQPSQAMVNPELESKPLAQETLQMMSNVEQEIESKPALDARPLAMEANSAQPPEVDRPLFYESKQPNSKPKIATAKPIDNSASTKKGNVSFSSTELSADDALPESNKPKLLIDGVSNNSNSSNVQNVRDLPESTRTNLNQYEVNVHVFDDEPQRRFVLINMDKYKEGDRIINNGPLVEEITAAGVVVDYGNGRALLPPK